MSANPDHDPPAPPPDPRLHYCHAPDCKLWGMFGSGRHWWCGEHKPKLADPQANAVRSVDDIRLRQSRLL
ncbi:hypothetical protein ACIU1J_32190 [Azospirillum doebereinerae]|uniref:hypothetical protein n=1 Tax=Azospirillum doebereinerae TaxID=92933 RepID=UPI001EE52724|nr:hypothetical protein [Azospirillum doebereinerae]MCG5238398.1 hypothetical protein [Azospirillum doebereinerae]